MWVWNSFFRVSGLRPCRRNLMTPFCHNVKHWTMVQSVVSPHLPMKTIEKRLWANSQEGEVKWTGCKLQYTLLALRLLLVNPAANPSPCHIVLKNVHLNLIFLFSNKRYLYFQGSTSKWEYVDTVSDQIYISKHRVWRLVFCPRGSQRWTQICENSPSFTCLS